MDFCGAYFLQVCTFLILKMDICARCPPLQIMVGEVLQQRLADEAITLSSPEPGTVSGRVIDPV